jgi:hypothetical protein
VLAAGWASLAALGYGARDPDSRLYAEISARMAQASAPGWIAPDFPPGWFMRGPFREHPVGLFVPAAALGALGYPASQAAYAMNAVYQVMGLVLLQRLAATLAPGLEARSLGWLVQLLPIAFTFRIRANHEAAVLLCLLAALYGTERARREIRFAPLIVAGLVGLLLVVLWLVARRLTSEASQAEGRGGWLGVAVGIAAMGITAFVYELLYRHATGEPFWSSYASRQLGIAAAGGAATGLGGPLFGLVFYLGRVIWFSFPWSLVLLGTVWRFASRREPSENAPLDAGTRAGALFTAAVVALYVGLFSLSERRADRYIFPAYYAVGAAGGIAALRLGPALRRLAASLDRPWVPAAVWGAVFLAHLFAGRLGLPTVKVWAP